MEAKAVAKFIRMSPGKARLVVDQIRGVRAEDALNTLHFSRKAAAVPIEKTLRSAIANLIHKSDGDTAIPPESFIVSKAFVDAAIADGDPPRFGLVMDVLGYLAPGSALDLSIGTSEEIAGTEDLVAVATGAIETYLPDYDWEFGLNCI